ncbi:hypothetical protein IWQ57_003434, partial [Coemansia nantahalensis]
AERLEKQGLRKGQPALGAGGRKVVVALLLITLGSALYQVLQPLFAGLGRPAGPAPKTEADLTREQQAKAAAAVLQALNRQATEKYLKSAKDYKPPPAPMAELTAEPKADDDNDDADADADDDADAARVWADAARPAMEPLV